MQKPFFSIVVVSLNPGERLEKTLNSILSQTYKDYEVILKDGGSKDGSLEKLQRCGFFENRKQIRVIRKSDKSIYDGMNQAVSYVNGKYVQFLNCGDYFYSDTVLQEVAEFIEDDEKKNIGMSAKKKEATGEEHKGKECDFLAIEAEEKSKIIYYGNQYNRQQRAIVYSAPQINDFTCYRNVPCHQVCFYDYRLFEKRAYELNYKVRADYEHFLYSIYKEWAKGVSMPVIVASYEGGGFSETKENRKRSALEHREITGKYLGKKAFKYRLIMLLTLAPIRTWIAENPALSGGYNGIKRGIYKLFGK